MATNRKTAAKKTAAKKTAAKKTTAAQKKAEPKAPEPMDPDAPETTDTEVQAITHRQRNVYAMDTLIAEVRDLFPETEVVVSNHNRFNAALDVQFASDTGDHEILRTLLALVKDDERVAEVLVDTEENTVLVAFHPLATTQDRRDAFGLAEAYGVLTEVSA